MHTVADEPPRAVERVGSIAQRLHELPYEKRVCRLEYYPPWAHDELALAELDDQPVIELVDILSEAGVEMVVVPVVFNRGTPRFHSKMLEPHHAIDRDPLPLYLEELHRKGILAVAYWGTRTRLPLKALHPEWMTVALDDGRPPIENIGWPCFNSPFREWTANHLIECMEHLDIDGFFFDGNRLCLGDSQPHYPGCCCPYCEKLFREETGLQIPRRVDFDAPDFRQFINWRYEKVVDFMLYLTRRVKEKYPDAIMDYQYYARPTTTWEQGHPHNPLRFNEVGGNHFIEAHRTRRETGFVGKIGRALGTPFGIWRNTFQTLSECATGSAPCPEPYPALMHGLSAMVNGGAPAFGNFAGPLQLGKGVMKQVFSELKKRADYIEGDTIKYVALHSSQQNRDFRPSERPNNTLKKHYMEIGQKEVLGAYELLNRSHLLVDIVLDGQLTRDHLSRYPVLFLADSTCLSDAQCDEIGKCVSEGGTLIAAHETSTLDEWGKQRDNFGLSDLLGLDYKGLRDAGGIQGVVYVPQDDGLQQEFGPVICFAAEESRVAFRAGADVGLLCTRSRLRGEFALENRRRARKPLNDFDPDSNYDSSEPAVTLHRYGKGQAIYISGNVGAGYAHSPYPPLKRFVASLVKRNRPPHRG